MVLSSKNHDFCRKIFTESNISALISDLLAKGYINYDHLTALVKVNPPPSINDKISGKSHQLL